MFENFERFGRSGCGLSLVEKNCVIRKTSSSIDYNTRLILQCERQKLFEDYRNFTKPKIYSYNTSTELHSFDMEYVYGKSFDKFCLESSINNIITFASEIGMLIQHNLKYSVLTSIKKEKFNNKLQQLKKTSDNLTKPFIDYLISKIPEELIIGPCHGDLTMSNIIFSDKYYLIDFLDNVFDTPLIDLVKIKQDTEHNFFLNFITYNNTKVKICLDYIDKEINKLFSHLIYSDEFIWLSIYNLVRILPYLKNEKEKQYLINRLYKYENFIASRR